MHLTFGVSVVEAHFDPRSTRLRFVADTVALGKAYLRVLRFFSVNIIHTHLHQHLPLTKRTNGWSLGNFFWSAKEYAPLTLLLNTRILSPIFVCASYDSNNKHQLFSYTILTGWFSVDNINRLAVLMGEDCITWDRNRIFRFNFHESNCHVVNIQGGVPPTYKSKQLLPSRSIPHSTVTYHRLHVKKTGCWNEMLTVASKRGRMYAEILNIRVKRAVKVWQHRTTCRFPDILLQNWSCSK
jgi:hypothetical protein